MILQNAKPLNKLEHPYFLVASSSIPILTSLVTLFFVSEIINYFYYKSSAFILELSFLIFFIILLEWFYNISKESIYHTKLIQLNNKVGFLLFIFSEVMFFMSLFWAFFHASLSPTIAFNNLWPPKGVTAINAFGPPTWGTWILWLSSIYALHVKDLILCNFKKNIIRIFISFFFLIILAVFFTGCQFFEFKSSTFSFREGIYGSVFYLLTGFHGLHVIIGTIFLIICGIRFFFKIASSVYFFKVIQILKETFFHFPKPNTKYFTLKTGLRPKLALKKSNFFNKELMQWQIYFKFLLQDSTYESIVPHTELKPYLEYLRSYKSPWQFGLFFYSFFIDTSKHIEKYFVGSELNTLSLVNSQGIKERSLTFIITFRRSKLHMWMLNELNYWKVWEPSKFSGLEVAIWYWQFVDIIWIFVWIIIYIWGNKSLPFDIKFISN